MNPRVMIGWLACTLGAVAGPVDDFVAEAKHKHGQAGERAAQYLAEHMPARDRELLTAGFLSENLDLAFDARAEFPWAAQVPEEVFLNDVLPYAVFNEARDPWRREFLKLARPLVKDAKSASEAALALNRGFFDLVKVRYDTGRQKPNQSPKESMASGLSTCTGLSVLLVDACRAVGIPARAAGIAMWPDGSGNHTWVEIWDGGWHFTGAAEPVTEGLDHAWFTANAARAEADLIEHAIHATSWKRGDGFFPMIWSPQDREVAAVNVTARYARPQSLEPGQTRVGVRLFSRKGGDRQVADFECVSHVGKVIATGRTKAGHADMNDMARLALPQGSRGWLRFRSGGKWREMAYGPLSPGAVTLDAVWPELAEASPAVIGVEHWLNSSRDAGAEVLKAPLSKGEAERISALLSADALARLAVERADEMKSKVIVRGDKSLRWMERTFGDAPAGGRSLWISMHGGGGAPPAVNDQQWQNQVRLYQPAEGIYVAPRAPTDTWNLWHEEHIDPMLQRLIEGHVALRGVNPDKVYLMGYSAGGDGVWQLAPRMADCFAAAAMMAGHPNESSLLGLRNLPFALLVGAQDSAVNRNKVAVEKSAELDGLAAKDPGGYVHLSRIYEGLGHWMDLKDAEALPWMAGFRRNPWPTRIVWYQDDVIHDRFYWLKLPGTAGVTAGQKMVATIEGNTVRLAGDVPGGTEIRLCDGMIDLEREVTVEVNDRQVFSGKVPRRAADIVRSLGERVDPPAVATAVIVLP